MSRLKIAASGNTPQMCAQARGKLFEEVMGRVLRHYGYQIDRISNVNYAGMEIDIEGRNVVTGIPLYAECKCQDSEVDSPKLQSFFGKYMALWLNDNRCNGIFVALPGINSHAKGFYNTYCENKQNITVRLFEEEICLDAIIDCFKVCPQDEIIKSIPRNIGEPGESTLLYTDKGIFWIQYIIPVGKLIPNSFVIINKDGDIITDNTTIDYIQMIYSELKGFEYIRHFNSTPLKSNADDSEQIVEIRGGSSCFEYQFPASPSFFVGRQSIFDEVNALVKDILIKNTSARGIVFEANSGWGKSSVVLKCVDQYSSTGHYAVAIDCRSASSSQFVLRMVNHILMRTNLTNVLSNQKNTDLVLTGFADAAQAIINVGKYLEEQGKLLIICLDQFENMFFLADVFKRVIDLLLKIYDSQTNILLVFSWKTDLIGFTNDFPYQDRDLIRSLCKIIPIEPFSDKETSAMLKKLSQELQRPLREDLQFLIADFSQGYPWLLKKLCAHVRMQCQNGISQSEIANNLLNVEELFHEDVRGLTPLQLDVLHHIAKLAPVSILELGDRYSPDILQSLVNARLVITIGAKYDIYWDIFRDYLNHGYLPIQENYMLRSNVRTVYKVLKHLVNRNESVSIDDLKAQTNLQDSSISNILRDMKLIGLVSLNNGLISLNISLDSDNLENEFRIYLKEKLQRNRIVIQSLNILAEKGQLRIRQFAEELARFSPYISAAKKTWDQYARIIAGWMDTSNLCIMDNRNGILMQYKPGIEVRHNLEARRRRGIVIPCVQYSPIETVLIRLVAAAQTGKAFDASGLTKSTLTKSLTSLEDLQFIVRKAQSIEVLPIAITFAHEVDQRSTIFAKQALEMASFRSFIEILQEYKNKAYTLKQLSTDLVARLSVDWKESTAETNTKIMLDWARHAEIAPGIFAGMKRGPRRPVT